MTEKNLFGLGRDLARLVLGSAGVEVPEEPLLGVAAPLVSAVARLEAIS